MPPPRSQYESPSASAEHLATEIEPRKRVTKACDRCRLKKIKCDGQLPCSRCQAESSLCRYSDRKKSVDRKIPPGYVEYLEEQQALLVKALKKSYMQSMSGSSSAGSSSEPSINYILAEMGVLAEASVSLASAPEFSFEEDLEKLRNRLEEEADDPSSSASLAEPSGPTRTVASSPDPHLSERSTFYPRSVTPQTTSAPQTPSLTAPVPPQARLSDMSQGAPWAQQQAYMPQMPQNAPQAPGYWPQRMQQQQQIPSSRAPMAVDTRHTAHHAGGRQGGQVQSPWTAGSTMDWTVDTGDAAQYNTFENPFTISPSDLQLHNIPEDFPIPDDPALRSWFTENRE